MPWSVGLFNHVLESHVAKLEPKQILDVGCGSGQYSELFRRLAPDAIIEAVEPTERYWSKYELDTKYDYIYKMPVQEFTKLDLKIYDLIVCFDILEHLYLSESIDMVDCLTHSAKNIIIAWPSNCPQGNFEGNLYEKHKSNMLLSDLTRFDVSYYHKVPLSYEHNIYYHYAIIRGVSADSCSFV